MPTLAKILCGLLLPLSLAAQPTYKQQIYQAYVQGDMHKWHQVIGQIEQAKPATAAAQLELVNYYYGYIGYLLGQKRNKEADVYVQKGEALLESLERKAPSLPEVYAYKSSYIGFRIALAPYKAPFIGGKSADQAKQGMQLDSLNIQANIAQADVYYYTPAAFGGDKAKAQLCNRRALRLMEANPAIVQYNWQYLGLLTRMAKQAEEQEDYAQAKAIYQQLLRIEPDYQYVKNELLPALLRKLDQLGR